jgi:hypothetical protein
MAEIIAFADIVAARRRAYSQACTQACIDLIEVNLRLALEHFVAADLAERPLRARRIRVLSELLEYALHVQ